VGRWATKAASYSAASALLDGLLPPPPPSVLLPPLSVLFVPLSELFVLSELVEVLEPEALPLALDPLPPELELELLLFALP
jgi:hypothetical protein